MLNCLYKGDYGPPDPGFQAELSRGTLLEGFEAHRSDLAAAQNIGQLEAMERKFARGETVQWCDQGYSWVYQGRIREGFWALTILVLIPFVIVKAMRRFSRNQRWPASP